MAGVARHAVGCQLVELAKFMAFVVCWCFDSPPTHAWQSNPSADELRSQLDDALAEKITDSKLRMQLVQRADASGWAAAPLQTPPNAKPLEPKIAREIFLKTHFVAAVTHFHLNELDTCEMRLATMRSELEPTEFPELWFRYRSLSAALGLVQGKREESLQAYHDLLADNHEGIQVELVERARINYAAALNENGRTKEAASIYESTMLSALEKGSDKSALHAGNNLIAMFMQNEEPLAARRALTAIQPLIERNKKLVVTDSLRLRELALTHSEGQVDQAIKGLNDFITRPDRPSPNLIGASHRLLAGVFLTKGDVEQALVHAKQAFEMLAHNANELPDAKLTLAEVHLVNKDYDSALELLNTVDVAREQVPSRVKLANQLRLQASLLKAGNTEQAEWLTEMINAGRSKNNLHSQGIYRFFESQLIELQRRVEEQQALAKIQIQLEADRERRQVQYLLVGLASVASLGAVALFAVEYRRRAERRRAAEQQVQNERLEALVVTKTQELTANIAAQAELSKALERKKRVETIGLLAGNVAHDINNLLQVVANANQAISNDTSTPEERQQLLKVSNDSLRHGSGIIRQLLAYSRQQELTEQSLCITDYLNEIRALLHSAIGSRVTLKIANQLSQAFIRVDSTQLTSSLINLLTNAADAMPEGGNVTLATRQQRVDSNNLPNGDASQNLPVPCPYAYATQWSSLQAGDYLLMSVQDSGCGMNEEQLQRAFEPFFSTKSVKDGTGLGLSSVHGFVKQSGGDIRILSSPGVGTEVQIMLPLVAAIARTTESSNTTSPPTIAGKRILVVEDHAALAESLMMLLGYLQLRCEWVASGSEAVKRLESDSQFDYVLSDVHMPGSIDGPALASWVKNHLPKLPVFLMSGYHDLPPEKIDVPLLSKPFNIKELASFLNQHA